MKGFGLAVLGLILIVNAVAAQALTINFAWDPPLANSDGSPLTIDGYTFYRSIDGGTSFTKLLTTSKNLTTATDAAVPPGNICYQVTAFNTQGESAASNRLCFQVPSAKPNAPSALRRP